MHDASIYWSGVYINSLYVVIRLTSKLDESHFEPWNYLLYNKIKIDYVWNWNFTLTAK